MNNSKVTFDEKGRDDRDIEIEYLRIENSRLRLQLQNAMTYITMLKEKKDDLSTSR